MILGANYQFLAATTGHQDLAVLVKEAQARGQDTSSCGRPALGRCESGEGEHWRPVFSHLEPWYRSSQICLLISPWPGRA